MKKTLLSLSLMAIAFVGHSQNCTELFISEYVESTNNDKALEIYNPTAFPITINNDYRIVRYNNGTGSFTGAPATQQYVILKQHTIQPYDVWVLAIDKRNPSAACPGNDCAVSAALQLVVDTFVCPDYNISYALSHNGNDAISLQKNVGGNWIYLDIFGEIGFDPIIGWADCPPFYASDCVNSRRVFTEDHTMIRKSSVRSGRTVNDAFNPTVEWDTLTENKLVNNVAVTNHQLGSHSCDCAPVGIKEYNKNSEFKMFPNPALSSSVLTFLSADKRISTVKIINVVGQNVLTVKLDNPSLKFDQKFNLPSGVYFADVIFENHSSSTEKLIIE
jgi:hypothetical protein